MSELNIGTGKLPPSFWRGILIFSVLWLAIGFGAAIAWGNYYSPEKSSARMVAEK